MGEKQANWSKSRSHINPTAKINYSIHICINYIKKHNCLHMIQQYNWEWWLTRWDQEGQRSISEVEKDALEIQRFRYCGPGANYSTAAESENTHILPDVIREDSLEEELWEISNYTDQQNNKTGRTEWGDCHLQARDFSLIKLKSINRKYHHHYLLIHHYR